PAVPALVTADADWLKQVERVSVHELLFRTRGLGRPADVLLAPFYQLQHERYTVYWEVLTPAAWDQRRAKLAALDARWRALPGSAVDFVEAGDPTSEGSHAVASGKSETGAIGGRTWRQAQKGEMIAYQLKTHGQGQLALECAYGANDRARKFDVWVDGSKVASPKLEGGNVGEIVFERYAIPAEALAGKSSVTVKFQADTNWDGATANLFACALVGPGDRP
ncbi:MAG TPA: DUF6805 domain-containing protein, partial [Steroidobacteraceae bacterium]